MALLQKQIRKTTWDDGVLRDFMATGARVHAWDIQAAPSVTDSKRPKHRLLLVVSPADAQRMSANAQTVIGETLGRLLGMLETPRPITTILWWRDDPRHLGADAWPTRREINGGWTVAGSSVICVYRSEEWERVVLHEMIHALEWDWPLHIQKPLPCWGLPTGSRMMPAFFEAWTELLAEWWWCGFFGADWRFQRAWQDRQAVQILARHPMGRPWVENTSVFAYYVLKAALAPYMPTLWLHPPTKPADLQRVLCDWTSEPLSRLRQVASHTSPVALSLSMTHPPPKHSSPKS